MKKLALLLLLNLCISMVYAFYEDRNQLRYPNPSVDSTPVFMPILVQDHVWNYCGSVPMSRDKICFRHKVGDSPMSFGEHMYYPVLKSLDSLGVDWEQNYEKIWLREDNGKLWSISEQDNNEELILDMHLSLGDTFLMKDYFGEDTKFKVFREDTIIDLMGTQRKRLSLYCLSMDENYFVDWIDGIGASRNFFRGDLSSLCFIDYEVENTLCMHKDNIQVWEADEFVWHNDEVRSCWMSSNTDNYFTGYFSLYPNPTKDIVNFSLPEGLSYPLRYEVVQIATGSRVEYGVFEAHHDTQLEVGYLPSGIYILRLMDHNGKMAIGKVVVE